MSIGIYVHIPYCRRKCKYCAFVSTESADTMRSYVNAVKKDIESAGEAYGNVEADSIYFGGGTPSVLFDGAVETILDKLAGTFRLRDPEITVEANPESVSDKLDEYKRAGVNRISIGVQSLSDEILKKIGRIHDRAQAIRTIDRTCSIFGNVSADVMLGLPSDTTDGVLSTLSELTEFPLKHLSAYGLKIEENTPLYGERGNLGIPDDDTQADMYEAVVDFLRERGFERYEISNFARPGYESRHNLKYWECCEYLGIGVAAHGYMNGERFAKTSDIARYIDNPAALSQREPIPPETSLFEHIMLGLRLEKGIDIDCLNRKFGIDFLSKYRAALSKLSGILRIDGRRLAVKPEYFFCLNSVLVEFMD